MSTLFEKDTSALSVPNVAESETDNPGVVDLSKCKITGSFDAEIDLLESTLSELKDGELDITSCSFNVKHRNDKFDSTTSKSAVNNINSDSTSASEIDLLEPASKIKLLCISSQDTSNNRPDSAHTYSLPITQHSKSICHQGDTVVSLNNSEDFVEIPDKTECNQTGNNSDNKFCDKLPSLSLENFEVTDRDSKSSVSVAFSAELSRATIHSDKGCDLEIVKKYPIINFGDKQEELNFKSLSNLNLGLHSTLVKSVTNRDCSSVISAHIEDGTVLKMEGSDLEKSPATMGDAAVLSFEGTDLKESESSSSCYPNKTSGTMNIVAKSELNGSEVINADISQLADLCGENENPDKLNETKNKEESLVCDRKTPSKLNCEVGGELVSDPIADENYEPVKKQEIYCSTPNVIKRLPEDLIQSSGTDVLEFGLMSPLDVKCLAGKQNLKRKYNMLQPIEEIDEDGPSDPTCEKKNKVDKTDKMSLLPVEPAGTSTHTCFEAPAKSLLKMWQPSCLSRNVSSTTFIVLDECGESELENSVKPSQEYDSSRVDDFEIACQSLMSVMNTGSSSNIETLEKYHSQVQLENQMDDEKFDQILKELTMNVDLTDINCLLEKTMDESTFVETDKTCCIQKTMEESVDSSLSGRENQERSDNIGSLPENNTTVIEATNYITHDENKDVSIEDKKSDPEKLDNITEAHRSSNNKVTSEIILDKDKPSSSDEVILDIDEEDFLLDENVNTQDKAYEFFEFVSTDPKENEDNYNPEWQKLGGLTSDEERYKAVRDRWRSLVPPNPNRDLTYRQWRARNNKSPLKLSLNNNHELMGDNQKNQLCTAVFDNKIKKIVQELEDSRMNIYRERNRKFEILGRAQDEEQLSANMRGFNIQEMAQLHYTHLNQCRAVKNQYDQELKRMQEITEGKIKILREAKNEVLLFQKFYKGVGAQDDNEMYLTDFQVQELMETEEMLEQYRMFYK